MLEVTVDGRRVRAGRGSILEALGAAGVEVPALCHDPRLEPIGGCRLCVVRIKGRPRPVSACDTPLADGMEIETRTPELEDLRRANLRLLARRYPADVAGRFPDKPFHRWLRDYGVEIGPARAAAPAAADESNPYIRADMSRCISCLRCARVCDEVQGQFVWRVWNRGADVLLKPDSGGTLRASSCVSCGACVSSCPTGALEDKTVHERGAPSGWTRTVCPYCGVGCEMTVGAREGRIVEVLPVLDAPVNKGHLCVKGRYAFEFVRSGDRATRPLIREAGRWRPASWDEAISLTARRLGEIVERGGPDAVGVLGSARATNEENYLAQKFARAALGTNNVDCCARVCHAPTAAAMKLMLGAGAATNSFDDIERTRAVLLCGANATENHPVVGARLKQAVLRGAKLIVIDPRRIELAEYADVHLRPRPGTNVPLLNAMACAIVQEGLCDEAFLRERVSGAEEFRRSLAAWAPERAAALCGVEAGLIRKAARLYAAEKPAMSFHGLGVTEHSQGTEGVMCLVNLALLTGNLGKRGAGVNPLRGQNNVQGAAHMGCEPGLLAGSVPIEEGRPLVEKVWGVPLPRAKGLNLMQMLEAAQTGELKALWAIGYDVALTNPGSSSAVGALRALEFVVVQDLFLNETAKACGSVFLPCASSFEKDGTFMNSERRIQRARKAVEPPDGVKTDWEIISEVARRMGKGRLFDFRSPEEIWNEIRAVWKAGGGISYERLERGGLQWPCPAEDHPGTAVLHEGSFPVGPRAALKPVDFKPTGESVSEEFPFLLMTGRSLYQFNAGTMTMRTLNKELRPADEVDICAEDAGRLGLRDGQRVLVQSRHGAAELAVHVSPAVKARELFATFHTAEAFVNRLTGPGRDPYTQTPEYKVTAVRISPSAQRPSPSLSAGEVISSSRECRPGGTTRPRSAWSAR